MYQYSGIESITGPNTWKNYVGVSLSKLNLIVVPFLKICSLQSVLTEQEKLLSLPVHNGLHRRMSI